MRMEGKMFNRGEIMNCQSDTGLTLSHTMNLSFAGCGFMGFYHIGVVACFREFAPEVLKNKV